MKKINGIIIGFIAGIAMVIGCSSSGQLGGINSSIANALGNAIDVIFDNNLSELEATNVQSAIEELNAKIKILEGSNLIDAELEKSLIGSWIGNYCNGKDCVDVSLTLEANGQMSCTGGSAGSSVFYPSCSNDNLKWETLKRVLMISHTQPDLKVIGRHYFIVYSDSNNLLLTNGVDHLFTLKKNI